jgi:hypothetical protein
MPPRWTTLADVVQAGVYQERTSWGEQMTQRREEYVVLTLEFKKEGRRWVGRCRELSTSTFASTFEAAKRELNELVILHLNELEAVGERERFFKEHGIQMYSQKPANVQRQLDVGPFGDDWLVLVSALEVPSHAPDRELAQA